MEHFRHEVRVFMSAAETILSPVSLNSPLNSQEREIISFYAQSLLEHMNHDSSQSHS
jgi:hypothetical protein